MPRPFRSRDLAALLLTLSLAPIGTLVQAAPESPDAADGMTPDDRLRARIGSVLQRHGYAPQVTASTERRRRALAARHSATTRMAAVPKQATSAQAVGLVLRLHDAGLQRQLEAGQPAPAWLMDALSGAAGMPLTYLRPMSGNQLVLRFGQPLGLDAARALPQHVAQVAAVAHAELDLIVQAQLLSRDPHFASQWNMLDNSEGYVGGIGATLVWDHFTGTSATVVAVVDSGVVAHPDFGNRLLPGYDFVSDRNTSNDGDGRDAIAIDPGSWAPAGLCGTDSAAKDSSWHGTHVVGIVGAAGDNGVGIAGVNWQTRLLPVRVLGRCGGTMSDIIDGIRWAAGLTVPLVPVNRFPAQVINLSLGGYSPDGCNRGYRDAIAEARGQGALVVVAAGNSADDVDLYTPANCEGVMTVVAVDHEGEIASYSNYGFSGHISAPGGDISWFERDSAGILSTVGQGSRSLTGYGYAYMQGTSMAAPHVSGIASLALGLNEQLSGEELRYIMEVSTKDFPSDSLCKTLSICGNGIADALTSVAVAAVMSDYQLVYEFYNEDIQHYFRTGAKSEAAGINRGAAGEGWYDTGDYFYGWTGPVDGAVPVCRFYGTPGRGPNSHFYTGHASECELVKKDPGWTYEGTGFYAKLPSSTGVCPTDTIPVYRVYNNGWRRNDSNHRYTTDHAVYDRMIAAGWAAEGVALCAFA